MAPAELERLPESDVHELPPGACSIIGKQAARKATGAARRTVRALPVPRVMLRYAIEKLEPAQRKRYLGLGRL